MVKNILLSFDLEEFDMPIEFGEEIDEESSFQISKNGLNIILEILDRRGVSATFFTTANFASRFPLLVMGLVKDGHEVACHGYYHSDDYSKEIKGVVKAKEVIEKIIKKRVSGFRAPRFKIRSIAELSDLGFTYDSSIHPIYLPGRYNNLSKKRNVHRIGYIVEIPVSTLPPNFSIFWLAFKNFPLYYSKIFTTRNFKKSNYNMLVFHPWEFTDNNKFGLPKYITRNPDKLVRKFEDYLKWCGKSDFRFSRIDSYLNKRMLKNNLRFKSPPQQINSQYTNLENG